LRSGRGLSTGGRTSPTEKLDDRENFPYRTMPFPVKNRGLCGSKFIIVNDFVWDG
jgi:hypothetical protein